MGGFYVVKFFFGSGVRLYYKSGAWVADWAIDGASNLSEARAVEVMTDLNNRHKEDQDIAFDISEVK